MSELVRLFLMTWSKKTIRNVPGEGSEKPSTQLCCPEQQHHRHRTGRCHRETVGPEWPVATATGEAGAVNRITTATMPLEQPLLSTGLAMAVDSETESQSHI